MKVILLKDVPNTGKKNDIKEVSPGFARNFLIPKKLAVVADNDSLKKLEIKKKVESENATKELKEVEAIVSKIDGQEIEINIKTGKEGQLFESVNKQKISERLKEMGYNIDKEDVILETPIKEAGEFPIKLKFGHNLEAEVRIIIKGLEEK
ncbi:MAG TPA: 50S ribosomal protein L9 [Candidatus Pacearchaeota archaeon]|nr:50S ribosomal protein L9 [Candidatus Pacearchaeota archaeon]HPR80056.1 50S ribosomal protein L9 [Candidatus Pacearchaeota archaeon]